MGDEKLLLDLGQQFLTNTPQGKKLLAQSAGVKENIEVFTNNPQLIKETYNRNKPQIATFSTKGRVFDQQTNEPIPGVKVEVFLGLYPVKLVKNIKKVKDPQTNIVTEVEEFKYEYDKNGNKELKTDVNGEYSLRFSTVVLPNLNNKVLLQTRVIYTLEGYAPAEQTIISQNGEVLQILPIKSLLNINKAAEIETAKIKKQLNNISSKVMELSSNIAEKTLIASKNRVLGFANVIQERLFPLAFGLMILFGIAKLTQLNQAKCPSDSVLKEIIKRRNSIVRQLNQIWGVIIVNTVFAGLFLFLSKKFVAGKITISSLPFPVSVPPGVGVPFSVISQLEDVKSLLGDLSGTFKELRKALIISLIFLIVSLILILLYLKKIDELIQKCTISQGIPMDEINSELLALAEGQTLEGEPQSNIVNGFKLEVVADEKSKQNYGEGTLYSRQAIAKNSSGIVILKGEPSFSADPQILIDELAFYIQNNNLKAD